MQTKRPFNSHLSVNNAPRASEAEWIRQDVMLCSFYKRLNEVNITYLHWSVQTVTRVEFSVYLTHTDRVTSDPRQGRLSAPADQMTEDWPDRSSPAGLAHIHVVVFYRHETTEDVFAEVKQVPPFRMTGANVNGSGCGFHFSYMHWLWPMIYTLFVF